MRLPVVSHKQNFSTITGKTLIFPRDIKAVIKNISFGSSFTDEHTQKELSERDVQPNEETSDHKVHDVKLEQQQIFKTLIKIIEVPIKTTTELKILCLMENYEKFQSKLDEAKEYYNKMLKSFNQTLEK